MASIPTILKKTIPAPVWSVARKLYYRSKSAIASLGPELLTRDYCGIKLFYNRGNGLITRLKKEPLFEKEMCESIAQDLSSHKGIFMDVGANIGLISAYITHKDPAQEIHAFEPGTSQRTFFEKTVVINNLKNILVYKEALGEKPGVMTFYSHSAKDSALDGFKDTGRREGVRPVEVPVTTLDGWWNTKGEPCVSVLKIDTEGAELMVLRGGQKLLRAMKPIIYLEIEPKNLAAYTYTEHDIKDFLREMGYGLKMVTEDTYRAEFISNP